MATIYIYDEANRLKSKTYTDATPSVSYIYDAGSVAYSNGHLTRGGGFTMWQSSNKPPLSMAFDSPDVSEVGDFSVGRVLTQFYAGADRPSRLTGTLGLDRPRAVCRARRRGLLPVTLRTASLPATRPEVVGAMECF